MRGDEAVYLKGHGVRQAGGKQPVTPDSLFCIGSLTKAFTTTAMAMLVDDGNMSWDDPVRKHVPYFHLSDPLADVNVTLRDLVTHRTGIGGHNLLWMDAPWSLEETIRRIGLVKPSFSFRTTYDYNNIMFNTAGFAVGYAAGSTWQEFVARRIFRPLGMSGVKLTASEAQQAPDHASPHLRTKQGVEATTWYPDDQQIRPAGSIKAGASDMSRWMRFHLNSGTFDGRRLVSSKNLRETHTPQIVVRSRDAEQMFHAYAMAWHVEDYRGHLLLTHTGSVKGFHANLALLPNDRIGIVVLSNLDASRMPEASTKSIMDQLLGLPKKDWDGWYAGRERIAESREQTREREHELQRHKETKPSRELVAYAGAYEEPAYGTARVSVENEALVLRWSSFTLPLEHYHFDTFDVTGERRLPREQVTFSLAAAGNVARMDFLGMAFQRAKPASLDWDAIALRMVGALRLHAGERVLLRHDPAHFADLIEPLRKQIRAAKAVDSPVPLSQPLSSAQLDKTDVYLWLPLGPGTSPVSAADRNRLARWLDMGGARRELHFHWGEGSVLADGLAGTHPPAYDALYQGALRLDPRALNEAQERVMRIMRTGTVRIKTPAGTDIMFRTGSRPFNKQNADASGERMRTARVRVDREIELPAGVLRIAPIEQTVAGQLVIPSARFGDKTVTNIVMQIDNGRVTRIKAEQNQAVLEDALKAGGDSARQFREFGLGFHPGLIATPANPVIPYYGYGAGVVRLSLGDNRELGGKVEGGFTRWFFFPDASVEVDGRYLVRNGKLAPEFVPYP